MGPINSHYDGQLQLLQREGEPSKVSPTIPRPLYSSFCTQQHIDCSAVTKRMGERATATPSIIIAISTGSKVQAAAARAIMPRGNVVNVTISLSRRKKHSARFTDIQFGSPTELGYRPDPNCVCDLRAPPITSTQHYQSFGNINLKMIRHSNFFIIWDFWRLRLQRITHRLNSIDSYFCHQRDTEIQTKRAWILYFYFPGGGRLSLFHYSYWTRNI